MRDLRRIALIAGSALLASYASVAAAPDGSGSGTSSDGDIEMEPDPVGSGSGSGSAKPPTGSATAPKPPTGSATGSAAGSAQTGTSETPPPEGPVKNPKIAKKWLSAAQQLVQKGDYLSRTNKAADAKAQYENAVTAYQKSIEAGDDVATYYVLAIVEDKLAHDADAYKHLKLVIDPKANAKPDIVKKAQTKLDEVTAKVGSVMLAVKPEGTQIQIAGKDVGEAPLSEPLILDPGTYTISFIAVGYQPKDTEIKVEAGSESEKKIDLEPVKIVVKPHADDIEPDKPPAGPPSKLPLYVGAGATGGLFVIGVITGIMAVSKHSTFVAPGTAGLDRQDAQSNGKTLAHVTDGLLVGTVLAAGFTAYWYQYRYKPAVRAFAAEKHPTVSKNQLAPWVQGDASGLSLVGSF